jgi:hypothetical protein
LIVGFVKEVPSPAAGLKRAKIVNDIEDSSSLIRRILNRRTSRLTNAGEKRMDLETETEIIANFV